MKLSVLVALLATGQAVQIDEKLQSQQSSKDLAKSKGKLSDKQKVAVKAAISNKQVKNDQMLQVEDSCTPTPQSCVPGYHPDGKGDCVSDVTLPLPSNKQCPQGFKTDNMGGCVSRSYAQPTSKHCSQPGQYLDSNGVCQKASPVPSSQDLPECQDGLILDTNGNCVNKPFAPAPCQDGFHSDGFGNCFQDNVPTSAIQCAFGYHSDEQGVCILDASAFHCSTGYQSDGNGICVQIQQTLVAPSSTKSSVVYTDVGTLREPVDPPTPKSDEIPNVTYKPATTSGLSVQVPITKGDERPSLTYFSNGNGGFVAESPPIPITKQITQVQESGSGFHTDITGIYDPVSPQTAGTNYKCSSGYHSDGNGNCIKSDVSYICADGYIQRSDGSCVLPPPTCTVGYVSDGNGNCIPISVTTVCAEGYASDGNGDCLLIPTTEGPAPTSTYTAQTQVISSVTSNKCTCTDECEIISEFLADQAFDKAHGLPSTDLDPQEVQLQSTIKAKLAVKAKK